MMTQVHLRGHRPLHLQVLWLDPNLYLQGRFLGVQQSELVHRSHAYILHVLQNPGFSAHT